MGASRIQEKSVIVWSCTFYTYIASSRKWLSNGALECIGRKVIVTKWKENIGLLTFHLPGLRTTTDKFSQNRQHLSHNVTQVSWVAKGMLTILSRCLMTTMCDEYASNWINEEVALQKTLLWRNQAIPRKPAGAWTWYRPNVSFDPTGKRAGRYVVRIPAAVAYFSLFHNIQTGPEVHPASCSFYTVFLLLDTNATTDFQLVPRLRITGVRVLIP
jgi:hypothetical protein